MKVLFVNSDSGYGSTGRITNDLYKALVSKGDEAIIGYGRENTDDEVNTIKIGNKLDVYAHVLKTRLFDLQGFGSLNATRQFIKKIKSYSPDIIHLHNIHGSYINIKLLFQYIKEVNIPVIWTLHDCWAYTGHCAYYTFVECDKWKRNCHNCEQKKMYPSSLWMDNSEFNFNYKKQLFSGIENMTITTVSNWLGEEVKESFLGNYNIKVIPNGIDLGIFKPTKSNFRVENNLTNKTILLGVASIWHDRKGLWLFNELAERLDKKNQIVLIGVTDSQKRQLSEKILTIHRTNNLHELAEIYSTADIFLNPSIEETFGMVTLEALACGTQVITNKYSANPELIDDHCGIIVDDIKTDMYIQAIEQLKKFPKRESDCISRAKFYDKNNVYQAYLELYKGVIA